MHEAGVGAGIDWFFVTTGRTDGGGVPVPNLYSPSQTVDAPGVCWACWPFWPSVPASPGLVKAARPARACLVFLRPAEVEKTLVSNAAFVGGARTSESCSGAEAGMGWRRLRGGELGLELVEPEDDDDEAGSESSSIESTSCEEPP